MGPALFLPTTFFLLCCDPPSRYRWAPNRLPLYSAARTVISSRPDKPAPSRQALPDFQKYLQIAMAKVQQIDETWPVPRRSRRRYAWCCCGPGGLDRHRERRSGPGRDLSVVRPLHNGERPAELWIFHTGAVSHDGRRHRRHLRIQPVLCNLPTGRCAANLTPPALTRRVIRSKPLAQRSHRIPNSAPRSSSVTSRVT